MIRRSRRPVAAVAELLVLALLAAACTGPGANDPLATNTDDLFSPGEVADGDRPFDTELSVASPDGELRIDVGLEAGRPRYRIVRVIDGVEQPVVADSTLGVETSVGSVSDGLTVASRSPTETVTSSFELPTGKARRSTATYNTAALTLVHGNSRQNPDGTTNEDLEDPAPVVPLALTVEVVAADDGAAIRYRLADDGSRTASPDLSVDWERTTIAVDPRSRAWVQPHDPPTRFTPAYEALRRPETAVADLPRFSAGTALPALYETPAAGWLLLAEAGLGAGHSGAHLAPDVIDGEYAIELAAPGDGQGIGSPVTRVPLPWTSPWRVFVSARQLEDVVATDLVRHLSPGGDPAPDWVRPGRSSWSWWSDHQSSRSADAIRPFIDLAADLGWEYSLIDANWTDFEDGDLEDLIAYGNERQVGLWLWYNSGGPHNDVTEQPRDRMDDRQTRRAELKRIAGMGIVGIKVDFFQSDKPAIMDLYLDIFADALEAGLMVNVHGSTVPRGWSRQFPNLMTMEAVRGAEFYTFDPGYAADAPRHNTELPFTRNVVGSMDYTPVVLGESVNRHTTDGHELALTVVFESGILHFADAPSAYEDLPAQVRELLARVPAAWDETRLLDGRPGTHAVIARRRGETWWVGAIDGSGQPRTISVDLEGLTVPNGSNGSEGRKLISACDDGDGGWDLRVVPAPPSIQLELPDNGGCLISLG